MVPRQDISNPVQFRRVSPGKRNSYPQQVLKLIPSKFWKLVPCRIRTSLPSFIQSYSSQGLITGLSSANCHGRSPSAKFFQSPAEFIFGIPSGVYLWYPQQSLSSLSQVESIIEVLSIPLIKTSAKYLFHREIPRPVVKDLFS